MPLVCCDCCGHMYDGNAQCVCLGIPLYDPADWDSDDVGSPGDLDGGRDNGMEKCKYCNRVWDGHAQCQCTIQGDAVLRMGYRERIRVLRAAHLVEFYAPHFGEDNIDALRAKIWSELNVPATVRLELRDAVDKAITNALGIAFGGS